MSRVFPRPIHAKVLSRAAVVALVGLGTLRCGLEPEPVETGLVRIEADIAPGEDFDRLELRLSVAGDATPFYHRSWGEPRGPLPELPTTVIVKRGRRTQVDVQVEALLGDFTVDVGTGRIDFLDPDGRYLRLVLGQRYTCGNGRHETEEQCDCGVSGPLPEGCAQHNSDVEPDACRSDCTLPRCGDGTTDRGEECDDRNATDTDPCTNACRFNVYGDGVPLEGLVSFEELTWSTDALELPFNVSALQANGDNAPDLLVDSLGRGFAVLINDGTGRSFETRTYAVDVSSGEVADPFLTGDVDGDGRDDLLYGVDGSYRLRFSDGDGGYGRVTTTDIGAVQWRATLADVNGDSRADLAQVDTDAGAIHTYLGSASGALITGPDTSLDGRVDIRHLACADLDNDGLKDLLLLHAGGALVSIARNDGSGAFRWSDDALAAREGSARLLPTRVDDDVFVDLLLFGRLVDLYLGDGVGFVAEAHEVPWEEEWVGDLQVADLDGDGHLDLARVGLQILLGDGKGAFRRPMAPVAAEFFEAGGGSFSLADLDGDGLGDYAYAWYPLMSGGTVKVHLNAP